MDGMEKAVKRTLGLNIRMQRQAIGLSQEELADKALLHRSYVGAVERGERNMGIVNLVRIARALEVEPCVLLMSEWSNCRYIIREK